MQLCDKIPPTSVSLTISPSHLSLYYKLTSDPVPVIPVSYALIREFPYDSTIFMLPSPQYAILTIWTNILY